MEMATLVQLTIGGIPETVVVEREPDESVVGFGQELRAARQDQGRSIVSLAREVGITAGYLSRIERGRASPSLRVVHRLAHALGGRVYVSVG